MTLKTHLIPCLDVKDGRSRAARSRAGAARTHELKENDARSAVR